MSGWLGAERGAAATDRILDSAGEVFAASGIDGTGMADIAREAGCSRATLYRYFEDRQALRRAFVHREARRIAAEVSTAIGSLSDPTARFVGAVTGCLREVRADPTLRAWFSAANSAIATELATESEVITAIGEAFLAGGLPETGFPGTEVTDRESDLAERARWTVRVIVSLLALPEADPGEERALVERFLAPVVVGASSVPTGQLSPDACSSRAAITSA